MGKARILMNAAPGKSEKHWDSKPPKHLSVWIEPGSGEKRAKALVKLTGAVITVVPGFEAYTPDERQLIFTGSRALTIAQIESGDFEVLMLEWSDRVAKKSGHTFNRIAVGE